MPPFWRVMLLQAVPEKGQDVHPEENLLRRPAVRRRQLPGHGVELATSSKESADYTAIVSSEVTWPNEKLEIYIQPHSIIRRLTFTDTMTALDDVQHDSTMSSEFYVEAVAHQQAAIEEL
jgi:hypothetical protein